MNKFNDLVSFLSETNVTEAAPVAPAAPAAPEAPAAPKSKEEQEAGQYIDLVRTFATPEILKIIADTKKDDITKKIEIERALKKSVENPDLSKIENFLKTTSREWKGGSQLKRLQMMYKGAAGLVLPTAKGSTGVYA